MAFELKKYSNDSKGVIVFSHNERRLLQRHAYFRGFNELKKKYVLGMYFGGYMEQYKLPAIYDYAICADGVVKKLESSVPRIPLNGFNFTSEIFQPNQSIKKEYDLICIANNNRIKNIDQYIRLCRELYNLNPKVNNLLITNEDEKDSSENCYLEMDDDFKRLFQSDSEVASLTIIRNKKVDGIYQLSKEKILYYLQKSKLLVLLSDREGASRVVAEALLSGVPVAVKKDLKGGTTNILNEANSLKINNLNSAAKDVDKALSRITEFSFDFDKLKLGWGEMSSLSRLEIELKKVFASNGWKFEGSIERENIGKRLPSHCAELPRHLCKPRMDVLKNQRSILSFLKEIYDIESSFFEIVLAGMFDIKDGLEDVLKGIWRKIKF